MEWADAAKKMKCLTKNFEENNLNFEENNWHVWKMVSERMLKNKNCDDISISKFQTKHYWNSIKITLKCDESSMENKFIYN